MSTTSSDPGSVPTNLACVTASAMFSIADAEFSLFISKIIKLVQKQINNHLVIFGYLGNMFVFSQYKIMNTLTYHSI